MTDVLPGRTGVLADRYRIGLAPDGQPRVLGQGAMATVYLAHDLLHQREVAIKVIRADLAPILGPDRFLREIRVASTLTHPHILPLLDSGESDGRLYYVMPVAHGQTLRARLDRERQLPLDDALRIASEIANALGYAHQRGIVHRDIKPENILLEGGHALVSDFGIARVIASVGEVDLSSSGLAFGTLPYMSPEQAVADPMVDGRSDIYSLGCVLYEMLAGERPFSGPTPQVIAARHLHEKVPSLAIARPNIPAWVQDVVEKALAKVPADRFGTAADFERALAAGDRTGSLHPTVNKTTIAPTAKAVLLVSLALAALLAWRFGRAASLAATQPDTTNYAILPIDLPADLPAAESLNQFIQDAVQRWAPLSLLDGAEVARASWQRPIATMSSEETSRVVRSLHGRRYFRTEATRFGDSLRIHIRLLDAEEAAALAEQNATISVAAGGLRSTVGSIVDRLLLRNRMTTERLAQVSSRSLPAVQSWIVGNDAVDRWELDAADSAFRRASELDPQFSLAWLDLAQARFWSEAPAEVWKLPLQQASVGRERLASNDQKRLDAIKAFEAGAFERACPMWRGMTRERPTDFSSWYGLATCVRSDIVVVPDHTTTSGWRFRTSYHEAVQAYRRAFELQPSIHRALRGDSYERVRDLLFVRGNKMRVGRDRDSKLIFWGFSGWQGDTLVHIPYRREDVIRGRPGVVPASNREASIRQRRVFQAIASAWATTFPSRPAAIEAEAIALELQGDRGAADTILRARLLAKGHPDEVVLAVRQVWLQLKFAIPNDTETLGSVKALADSLLAGPGTAANSIAAASLAALLGRANLAASLYAKGATASSLLVPTSVARFAAPLLAYASLGGPLDSLLVYGKLLRDAPLPPEEQAVVRREWLARAATLAFPNPALANLVGPGADPLLDAQLRAMAGGAVPDAARYIEDLRSQRRNLDPADVTLDALYAEARLLEAIGRPAEAANWLDPTLERLVRVPSYSLADLAYASSLIRALALRAELAAKLGRPADAARWAKPVVILWSGADPFLQPVVRRMIELAKYNHP